MTLGSLYNIEKDATTDNDKINLIVPQRNLKEVRPPAEVEVGICASWGKEARSGLGKISVQR